MKRTVLFLTLLGMFSGCSRQVDDGLVQRNQPLSVEEWKQMDVSVKYAPETFARLKQSDSRLDEERAWDAFMKDVVVPQRKIDIPTPY